MGGARTIFKDPELYFIIAFNAVTFRYFQSGVIGTFEVVFLYLLQSILIGIQYFLRMLIAKVRNKRTGENSSMISPLFFLAHYGTFHLVYTIFIFAWYFKTPTAFYQPWPFLSGLMLIALNTVFSLYSDVQLDKEKGHLPAGVFFIPYLRIVPMHLTIMFGSNAPNDTQTFLLFIGLKTVFDVLMHIVVNKTWKVKRPGSLNV